MMSRNMIIHGNNIWYSELQTLIIEIWIKFQMKREKTGSVLS